MKTIADHIDYFIKRAGYKSQADFCRKNNFPSSTLARILKNAAKPSLDNLIIIAKGCKITIDELVNGKPSPGALPQAALILATGDEIALLSHYRETDDMGRALIRAAAEAAAARKSLLSTND